MTKKIRLDQEKPQRLQEPYLGCLAKDTRVALYYSYVFLNQILGVTNVKLIEPIVKKSDEVTSDVLQQTVVDELKAVDNLVLGKLRDYYPLLNGQDSEQFRNTIESIFSTANEVINTIRNIGLPNKKHKRHTLDLLETTKIAPTNMLMFLKNLYNTENVTPRFIHEEIRQKVIALLCYEFMNSKYLSDMRQQISDIAYLLQNHVYEGKKGQLTEVTNYGIHDNQTNQVVELYDNIDEARTAVEKMGVNEFHIKEHSELCRLVPNFGYVVSNCREKTVTSSVIKAIAKAINGEKKSSEEYPLEKPLLHLENKISIKEAITDFLGSLFVVDDGKSEIFMQFIIDFLKSHYPNMTYKEKHQVGTTGNRGQSKKVKFKRILVKLHNENSPEIEMMFYDKKDFINSEYGIATREEDGSLNYNDAQAHELYQQRRIVKVARFLFPSKIYGQDDHEMQNNIMLNEEKIRQELLDANRC